MDSLLAVLFNQLLVFLLVLARVSGLVMVLPYFGSRSIPMRIRSLLAIGLAMVITSLYGDSPIDDPGNLINLAVLAARELALGMALGLGILVLFLSLQLTGEIIGQMSGMQLADIVNPNSDSSVPIFSQLLDLMAMAVFLTIGGHRQVMAALLDTFRWMRPGHVHMPADVPAIISGLITQSFVLGLRAAAPIIISMLLSILVMGLISRTLPQLNIIAVGFSFNSMVMLATLSICIGTAAWIFQGHVGRTIDDLHDAFLSVAER